MRCLLTERNGRERKELEEELERIFATHGQQHIADINIKVMSVNLEEATKAANMDLRNALTHFMPKLKDSL